MSDSGEIFPAEICRKVLQFLSAQDATLFTSVNRFLRGSGQAKSLWEFIYQRDVDKDYNSSKTIYFPDCAAAKQAVVLNEVKNSLPSLKWYPVMPPTRISGREGHIACTMTCGDERRVVLTGGFSDDSRIYMINPNSAFSSQAWSTTSVLPVPPANFVYGASLTPLPGRVDETTGTNIFRAVRYGGFRAGGYSSETNEVALLEITQPKNMAEPPSAKWTIIDTQDNFLSTPRAYHTATLLMDRYILFVGGMQENGSVLKESILDTHTWTWLKQLRPFEGGPKPSGRHGHSVILDSKRNRLVLFGGGSGSDLLRSGRDNAEVWELAMPTNWHERIEDYGKWTWRRIHGESEGDSDSDQDEGKDANDNQDVSENTNNNLAPAEMLCLGRCHMSHKIAPDMVLFFFGSGQPSTNGVIAYDLSTNQFHRPNVKGHLPCPRFTGASAFLEEGYILTHGGYSSQLHDSIGQMDVIDLVPRLRRSFDKLPIDPQRPSHTAISDAQAASARGARGHHLGMMQMFFASLAAAQRRGIADSSEEENEVDSDDDYEMDEEG